ncbi:pectinesterase inhibitor-like [Rhododendron vialii]|uniref:pectinesterase inhibitor-like n=1 Tax=Rhododendron vialii TaxID=182163 RepID=UPI00265F7BFA|nr:pectinesterase inhibitor-like [Rhododendron vialii]
MAFALRLSFFLLVFCLSTSGVLTVGLVDGVCAKTSNPSFCGSVLLSDGRSATADLTGLGNVAVDLAYANTKATFAKINRLKGQTKDVELKKRLDSCLTHYTTVIAKYCVYAGRSLDVRDYRGMYVAGDLLTIDAFKCDRAIFSSPPSYPCPVAFEDTKTSLIGDIIRTIAHILETK